MRLVIMTLAAAGCSLALASPATSQQKQQQTVRQVSPQLQERLRVQPIDANVQSVLRSEMEKRRFVAERLRRPVDRIGLTDPLDLTPPTGNIIAPRKAHITVLGSVDLDPSQPRFRLRRNASLYLRMVPDMLGPDTPYLVTAIIKVERDTRMSTRNTAGSRLMTGMDRLAPGQHALNFVVQRYNSDTFLQLFADQSWDLQRVEITPIRRE